MSFPSADDLQRIFNKLDQNGDGLISVDQLKWLLEKIGFHNITLDELQQLVGRESLDTIDFFLFYDIVVKSNNGFDQVIEDLGRDLVQAFKVFDMNGDGFISSEELQNVLSRLGLWDEQSGRDCKSMISMYDTNSDGMLDFEEFKNMMLHSD